MSKTIVSVSPASITSSSSDGSAAVTDKIDGTTGRSPQSPPTVPTAVDGSLVKARSFRLPPALICIVSEIRRLPPVGVTTVIVSVLSVEFHDPV